MTTQLQDSQTTPQQASVSSSLASISSKLKVMLETQDELNRKVNPEWKAAGYSWRSAIMVEAVELFDHLHWKWWKKYNGEVDWDQVKMEAVDIWHFIMADALRLFSVEELTKRMRYVIHDGMHGPSSTMDTNAITFWVKRLINRSTRLADPYTEFVEDFLPLISELGMTFDELYKLYIGKNMLNRVRYENDYGKTYIKMWDENMEDNQFLSLILEALDVDSPTFKDDVYGTLILKYEEVKAKFSKTQ